MAIVFLDPALTPHDGFDVNSQYQMVPAGGIRSMAFGFIADEDENEDVVIYCADPNKAFLFGLYTIQGQATIRGSGYFVKHNSFIRFFIGGRDPGATTLNVETVTGRPRGFLLLSVKPPLFLTYQLAIISDAIHVPDKAMKGNNLADNMLNAAKIWLAQANVTLMRVGPINDVTVPTNLGDPIFIDRLDIVQAIMQATFTKDYVPANLYIYGTWNILYTTNPNVAGSTSGNMCFIENQLSNRNGELLSSHEVGHALDLQHATGDQLMNGQAIANDFLDMWEIEWANRLPWPPARYLPWLYRGYSDGPIPYWPTTQEVKGGINKPEILGKLGILKSNLFAGDARLEACATSNPDHVTPGTVGPQVRKIQGAVITLDDAIISSSEFNTGLYGPSTARAVLAYKTKRNIVNRSYESRADDIVGIMTIRRLDAELLANQRKPEPRPRTRCPRICGPMTQVNKALVTRALSTSGQRTPAPDAPAAMPGRNRAV